MMLAVGTEPFVADLDDVADAVVRLPQSLPDLWRAPLYLPPLPLIAYTRAVEKGLNPDRPTHLSAVVTLDPKEEETI